MPEGKPSWFQRRCLLFLLILALAWVSTSCRSSPGLTPRGVLESSLAEQFSLEVEQDAFHLDVGELTYLLPLPEHLIGKYLTGYEINPTGYDLENMVMTVDIMLRLRDADSLLLAQAELELLEDGADFKIGQGHFLSLAENGLPVLPNTELPADLSLPENIESDSRQSLRMPMPGYWQGAYHLDFSIEVELGELQREYLLFFYESTCYDLYHDDQAGLIFFIYRSPLAQLLELAPNAQTEVFFGKDYLFATNGPDAYICAFPTGLGYPEQAPLLAKARYLAMASQSQTLLQRLTEENYLTPNPDFFNEQ